MAFLVASVVLVGALGVVNLLFSFGVIRRLREHTEILNQLGGQPHSVILEPGQTVADFAATTVDGRPVSVNAVDGPTLVGFFTPGCTSCQTKLPSFVEYAWEHPGGRERVLAVIVGENDEDTAPYVTDLNGTAHVVRDVDGGPVHKAFGVQGFPAFALIDLDGVVLASGSDVSDVSASTVKT